MSQRLRPLQAILAVMLLAGCAATPASPSASILTRASSTAPAVPPTTPAGVPSLEASPISPSSGPVEQVRPSPSGAAAVASPPPPDDGSTWVSIAWQKIPVGDPRAQMRSMTPWRGGYIALGDPAAVGGGDPTAIDEPVHTRVWTSLDGDSWAALGIDVLGPSTIVLGTGATADGIAALTVQAGTNICEAPGPTACWDLTGPLQLWTSSDAVSWTWHPGPGLELPPEMNGQDGQHPTLQPLTAPRLVIAQRGQPLAISRDGVAWELVPISAFPPGWGLEDLVAYGPGLVAVGQAKTKPLALTSRDGSAWTSHALPAACTAGDEIDVGPSGLIVVGTTNGDGSGVFPWGWCSSRDGRTWRSLPGLPPLGRMRDEKAQECLRACPDGSLRSDGTRMIAYRGWGKEQVGWTSPDGLSWTPLAFTGRPERSTNWLDSQCTQSLQLLPIGLKCVDPDGSTWFGTPGT